MSELDDMLNPQNKMAAIAAEFDRRGARIIELEAEVARLSRRPDLSPAQASHLADFFRSHVPASPMHPEDKAIVRALAATAQEETS